MIVNTKEMLEKAKLGHYAVPHFNINNLEWTRFILEECESQKSPVILGVSEGAIKYMGGYDVVVSIVTSLVKDLNITVPVAIHLDHGSSVESAKKAIDSGFTSVMYDGSKLDLDTNIKNTKEVLEYAKKFNATVEAEVGHIGGEEDGIKADVAYAKIEDCLTFYKNVNVDLFAPALGSVHGIYKGEPKLDFDRMKTIFDTLNVPLVLHGGSGIPDSLIKKAISCGICKININTELQLAWSKSVREFIKESEAYDPRKIIKSGEEAMKEVIRDKVLLLQSNGKA